MGRRPSVEMAAGRHYWADAEKQISPVTLVMMRWFRLKPVTNK
jgi:hypothetical protein